MTEEIVEDERDEELASIAAIFPELHIDLNDAHSALLDLPATPSSPLKVSFKSVLDLSVLGDTLNGSFPKSPSRKTPSESLDAEDDVETHTFTHLPTLRLKIDLPPGYPDTEPPSFQLSTQIDWIPTSTIQRLSTSGASIWEEYGRSQVVYAYIDFLQQEAESAFGHLEYDNPLLLPTHLKSSLLDFDKKAKRERFDQETYHCGICLEPKKGSSCHRLQHCGHVFCIQCLQDFYNSAITEGDVVSVKCLAPDCGKEGITNAGERRKRKQRTLHPTELLEIPVERSQVQRYVDLKLKKRLESDKNTAYCPRKWCQAPARSKKFARYYEKDLASYPEDSDSGSEDDRLHHQHPAANVNDGSPLAQPQNGNASDDDDVRLSICSKCAFAFCNICHKSWHGSLVNCRPRLEADLSAEEQASVDYIRLHTSPYPTCAAPCQKTHGCNHMRCFTCGTHFCYLCSAFLTPEDPYAHFNGRGENGRKSACYMRLWELEEGDEGAGMAHGFFGGARGAENAFNAGNQIEWHLDYGDIADGRPELPAFNGNRGVERGFDNQALQRFLQMAADDEEDEWDSGEEEGDVGGWEMAPAIRQR